MRGISVEDMREYRRSRIFLLDSFFCWDSFFFFLGTSSDNLGNNFERTSGRCSYNEWEECVKWPELPEGAIWKGTINK